jgi:hypothetical protein
MSEGLQKVLTQTFDGKHDKWKIKNLIELGAVLYSKT